MPSMTKTEYRGHILALKNKVKTAWETTPNVTAQEQKKRFELIEMHTQTELEYLNLLPETVEEVDYRLCLLGFVTYGSSKNERFLTAPPTEPANHDNNDDIINDYALTHALLKELEKETFLNRNNTGHWNKYLKSNPGITEKHYDQLIESRQNMRAHRATPSAFFSPRNNEGGETAEPIMRRHQRRQII